MTAGSVVEAAVGDATGPSAIERERFEEFFAAHRQRLVRYVTARCWRAGLPRSRVDPEDIVQDVLAEVWTRWSAIEEPLRYAYVVARRRVGEQPGPSAHEPLEVADRQILLFDEAGELRDEPFQALLQAEIYAAFLELPARQRTATVLRHVAGFSSQEIAERLGCSPQTVDVHVHRGIQAVRKQLAAEEPRKVSPFRRAGALAAAAVGAVLAVVCGWRSWVADPPVQNGLPDPDPGSPWIHLGDNGGGGVSWILIALGGLLVGFGIVAIVLLLRRRDDFDED